mgnify:CR=1 FL=1
MEIIKFTKYESGNIMGFLDIKTSEGFEMKGFKLVNGEKGMFIGAPSQKGKDGKYYDLVWIPKELNAELLELASNQVDLANDEVPF